uniref:Torsin-1A C-terminal domain-containing protein n=1 Tax=Romanomermis culicivorax TaxID=13658 RepID=A0A915JXS0_ROMCU
NTGGNDINTKYYEFWRKGIPRENVKLSDVEDVIIKAAFNEDGGLKYSELIKHHLIDHFVPFLPMERSHVRLCIKDYLMTKNYTFNSNMEEEEKFIAKVSDSLPYFPKDTGLFSSSGCKRVKQKVDLGLEELKEKNDDQV